MISWHSLILFCVTVIPLILTPGPDMLFVISQAFSRGKKAASQAVAGMLLGYGMHGILSALGIAALISASPFLFNLLKWSGVFYLAYLAYQMFRSSLRKKESITIRPSERMSIWKGFFTSFLNPKVILIYLAILPQFIDTTHNVAFQSVILSLLFIFCCGFLYVNLILLIAQTQKQTLADNARRKLEGFSAVMLGLSAYKIATQN